MENCSIELPDDEECDATKADSRAIAGYIKINLEIASLSDKSELLAIKIPPRNRGETTKNTS